MKDKMKRYQQWLITGAVCGLLMGCSRRPELILEGVQTETEAFLETETHILPETELTSIQVFVCGAVSVPGVYCLDEDARVYEAIEAAGGFKGDVRKLISGGPMMGVAQYSVETPVIKGTSGLLALTRKEVNYKKESPCVRCGKCVDACPMGLMPLYISSYSKKEDYENMKKYNIMDCIECGSCTYACPSNRNPVEFIRVGKAKLQLQNMKEDKK